MVTFLDIGLLEHFAVIFPFLLIFLIVFGILQKTALFGDNKGIHALIALSIAVISLFTPGAIEVIVVMAPWFVILFIFILLFLMSLKITGVSDKSITDYMSKEFDTAHWVILSAALAIIVFGVSFVYGSSFLPFSEDSHGDLDVRDGNFTTDTGNFNQNVGRVIFHPKTVGAIIVLLLGSFTIRMLAGATKK